MPSFGEDLRRERELREITLREVAEATKVNLRYLEAMERNDFSDLPGGLFNRGFVRAYCQFIGIDAEAMVNAYILEERAQGGSTNEPSGEPLLRGGAGVARARLGPASPTERRRDFPLGWALFLLGLVVLAVCAYLLLGRDRKQATLRAPIPAPTRATYEPLDVPGVEVRAEAEGRRA